MQQHQQGSHHRISVLAVRVTFDVLWAMLIASVAIAVIHVTFVFRGHLISETARIERSAHAHRHACQHQDLTEPIRRELVPTCDKLAFSLNESPFHAALLKVVEEEVGHFTALLFPLGWFAYVLVGTVLFALFVIFRGQHQQYQFVAPHFPFYQHLTPPWMTPTKPANLTV